MAASCTLFAGCGQDESKESRVGCISVPNVVTADIQAGIENHVEEEIRRGGGYFKLPFGEKELQLKLVRVHVEYLANLGPRRHFACVDLVDIGGDVYDVDFFLSGDPGEMSVTETTVHKINGQPYYAWEQQSDGTWERIAVEDASQGHFGVIRSRDEFEFTYRAILPEIIDTGRMWIPLPSTDSFQTVEIISLTVPGEQRVLEEKEHGNRILFLELGPEDSGKTVEIRYKVERREKAVYEADTPDPGKYLNPERPRHIKVIGILRSPGNNTHPIDLPGLTTDFLEFIHLLILRQSTNYTNITD